MCSLVELEILNLKHCTSLHGLPEGMHRLQNLQRLLIQNSPASRRFARGLGELIGLHTLRTTGFHGGIGGIKLGLLKKLNGLNGSLKLEIKYNSDLRRELVEDAREAELKNKIHIHTLEIHFENEHSSFSPSSSSSSSSSWMDIIEALEPNLPKQRKLVIWGYRGPGLPHWISSPLNSVKEIELLGFSDLPSLPPMGRLPFLELLRMDKMNELKLVGREFLGIESSSNDVVVAFPKLMSLTFDDLDEWSEWEDITVDEEESASISIMPHLKELHINWCKGLKKLPYRLLRKASSSLRILDIFKSPELQNQYGDMDGSPWRSISKNNPQLQLQVCSSY